MLRARRGNGNHRAAADRNQPVLVGMEVIPLPVIPLETREVSVVRVFCLMLPRDARGDGRDFCVRPIPSRKPEK